MPKKYFIEMQLKDQCVMNSRDFETAKEAKNWAEGLNIPPEYELWLMAVTYDEYGDAIYEEFVERLDNIDEEEPPTFDPCDRCTRHLCYGCPHAEEEYDA